jgi:translation initiation factor 4A
MSLNEMVENDGEGRNVDLNVNPNVTKDRDQEFYDQHICGSFENMELKDKLLHGIYAAGFEVPSAIQQKAIVPFTDKHDLIAQAQSGTGKTATFSIGLLQNINENLDKTQAIILTHTRELALQSYNVVTGLSKFMNIGVNLTIGGNSVRENIDELNNNPHVVIGTPGRILDMINKGALSTKYLQTLVVDEDTLLKGHPY